MEKDRKGEREPLANAQGSSSTTRREGDVDDDDPGLNAEAPGPHTWKGQGAHGGLGEGWSHQTDIRDYWRDDPPRMDCNGFGCKLLARFKGGHPCSHCPGGRNYPVCCSIRGVEK